MRPFRKDGHDDGQQSPATVCPKLTRRKRSPSSVCQLVAFAFEVRVLFCEAGEEDVGVISPYAAQAATASAIVCGHNGTSDKHLLVVASIEPEVAQIKSAMEAEKMLFQAVLEGNAGCWQGDWQKGGGPFRVKKS